MSQIKILDTPLNYIPYNIISPSPVITMSRTTFIVVSVIWVRFILCFILVMVVLNDEVYMRGDLWYQLVDNMNRPIVWYERDKSVGIKCLNNSSKICEPARTHMEPDD